MIIYHHNDLDGQCSAAIAAITYQNHGEHPYCVSMNYTKSPKFEKIFPDEKIVIVDYSFSKREDAEKLFSITKNIVWIDHHKTAIENGYLKSCRGLRSIDDAACLLTWKYFHPGGEVPDIVKFIDDMDAWKWKLSGTAEVIEALKIKDVDNPLSNDWIKLINSSKESINSLIQEGGLCLKYRDAWYRQLLKNSFDFKWDGLKCKICNCAFTGSLVFNTLPNVNEYDMLVIFSRFSDGWSVSLYNNNLSNGVDCSAIALKYGGGGHKGAAGFHTSENLPWITNESIHNS
jgi:uncharacterized protein